MQEEDGSLTITDMDLFLQAPVFTSVDRAAQAALMNATHILLADAAGLQDSTPAQHWRTRNGTADGDTSFSIAYNLCLAIYAPHRMTRT